MDSGVLAQHRRHFVLVRYVRARPRLFVCLLIGLVAGFLFPSHWHLATRVLLAWNLATILFLISIGSMMAHARPETIRRNAALQDEGKGVILASAIVAATASIAAIIVQLGAVKDATGLVKYMHLGLACSTILSSWAFVHVIFALHYAHEYFDEWRKEKNTDPKKRGLGIPGLDDVPDYMDFLYFAFVIGVASATADINITSRTIRRVALVHCVVAFFFNMAILGLTINIAAGLLS
ncbi:DUF1345 domain-containing protein [Methylovirgula sp. 4M-Z18]|uniref:DUF1345 domain-containing protein n=1 Tax=Methylovirgula sp. 4M-Z18 TaxID=2293567 RepID=UPI000E2FB746|nr:DUF1345 domain-containing protein [Methylovirgula sp. 4M-Z18]RFB78572.1 DUF1345 domain-containing protein [Methylovirgula sp. 4M-Z18]